MNGKSIMTPRREIPSPSVFLGCGWIKDSGNVPNGHTKVLGYFLHDIWHVVIILLFQFTLVKVFVGGLGAKSQVV